MTKPVTIILPTYNARKFLDLWKRQIDGMAGRENVKIISVDNGSTDGTQGFVKEHILRDGDQFFQNEVNLGHAGSCQRALEMVDTPYCIYINSDDYVGPEYIARSVEHLDRNPATSVTFGTGYMVFHDKPPESAVGRRPRQFPRDGVYRGDVLKAMHANFPVDAGLLVRTSVVKANGGFQHDFWFVLAQHNNNICFLDTDHIFSGKHPTQESKRYVQNATSHHIVWKFFNAISELVIQSPERFSVLEILHCSRLLGMPAETALEWRLNASRTISHLEYLKSPDAQRKIVYTFIDVMFSTIAMQPIIGSNGGYNLGNMGSVPFIQKSAGDRLTAYWELAKKYNALPPEYLDNVNSMLSYFKSKDFVGPP